MWGKININTTEEEFFKTKNYKSDGKLLSMKYSDNYINELIDSSSEIKKNNKDILQITIKEVN